MDALAQSATGWNRFAALAYDPFLALGELLGMRARRARLLASAAGDVLEIGAGTGLNVRHYTRRAKDLTLIEPDPAMARKLHKRVIGAASRARVLHASAANLPVPDSSIDTVVSTLVLCTVPDVSAVLEEIARVLRPGGLLLFCEHVRSSDSSTLARRQARHADRWAAFAQGCRCDRDTLDVLRGKFHIPWVERANWRGMPSLVRPLIMGSAAPLRRHP